jgi:SHS2 domain-containing protein
VDYLIFGKFDIHVEEDGTYRLKAKAMGESVDKHPDIFLHIKAVTFHDLRFEIRNNIYEAQVLLDI